MNKQLRKLFPLLLITCLVSSGFLYKKWHYKRTDGFSVSAVTFEIPFNEYWKIGELSHEETETLDQILKNKYSYLAKGARSFAFLSEDGKYVLKFFKFRYEVPHWTLRYLPAVQPFEYFRQKKADKVSLYTVLSGYKNGYENDPGGTGLIYIHLNQTDQKLPEITVFDKIGKPHAVDLNKVRFVLQRRAEELAVILDKLLKNHDVTLAIHRIQQTLDLYREHYQKGLYDLGSGLVRNNGFIEDSPVHFDAGKLTLDNRVQDPEFQKKALERLISNLDKWLIEHYPDHRDEVMQEVHGES